MRERELFLYVLFVLDFSVVDALLLYYAAESLDRRVFTPQLRLRLDHLPSEGPGSSKYEFRFEAHDVSRLRMCLRIPDIVTTKNRRRALGDEALCMLLRRLAYPCRWCDLEKLFGRDQKAISEISSWVLYFLFHRFADVLFFDEGRVPRKFAQYADAIHRKGAPVNAIWGFIDGTLRAMCRPRYGQRAVYNGHKRVHGLKFQSIVTPDGLLSDPIEGRRHDVALLRASNINNTLLRHVERPTGGCWMVYGDPAYPMLPWLMCPYKGAHITALQQEFNKRMSSVRQCVEWQFGKVVQLWAFVDFKKNMKVLLQPLTMMYKVCVLLTNCHVCTYGSQTATFFEIDPPTLERYLDY